MPDIELVAKSELADVALSGDYKDLENKPNAVLYSNMSPELTAEQKAQARSNIGALSASDLPTVIVIG